MPARAVLRHTRLTPRKFRPICDVIRGKAAQEAVDFLTHCRRRGARSLLKLVRSALANATQAGGMDLDQLYVREIFCNAGPTMKRWLPRAKGMASPILKRSAHLTVVLDERSGAEA